jgi:hypothetical protein
VSDQPGTPPQPFYNQSPLPNQQQPQTRQSWPQTGYSQQTGIDFGNQQPPYPQQSQWNQPSITNQQQWGQSLPNNSWQQQPPNLGQFQPLQPHSKQKRSRLWIILGIIGSVIVLIVVIGSFAVAASNRGNTTVASSITPINSATSSTQVVQSAVSPTATPAPSPTPTLSSAQIEAQYKASTTPTTVTNLDKDGTADQGKNVHFTCTISHFVKDSSGTTAGANVTASSSDYNAVIQIAFPSGTDITQLNQGDTVEVWGSDTGVYSGTNAFGGTVQEVGITVMYMTDQTTNYQAGS